MLCGLTLQNAEEFCSAILFNCNSRSGTMQTEHFKVTGMTCGGCSSNVTQALKAIAGVDDVNVSLAAGEATVQYDERRTSPNQLESAVKSAGYGVDTNNTSHGHQSKGGCCG